VGEKFYLSASHELATRLCPTPRFLFLKLGHPIRYVDIIE
jgi:hypothetical protein